MRDFPRRWNRSGLGAMLLGAALLAACGGETGAPYTPPAAEAGAGTAGEPADAAPIALDPALLLPVNERAARISGRVEAARALARAGATDDAAVQLRLAITDILPGGLPRLQEQGLDPLLFETAAAALEAGDLAESELAAVDANIRALRETAGGKPVDLTAYMTRHSLKAYREAVSLDNQIVDPAAFQEAYGYAVMARDYAGRIESDEAGRLQLELELLVRMWPGEGPLTSSPPAPVMTFFSQGNRVERELSTLQ